MKYLICGILLLLLAGCQGTAVRVGVGADVAIIYTD